MVPFAFNLANVNAKTMTLTQLIGVHPNFNTIGLRDLWMPAAHVDSRAVTVTFNRYAGKVAYHEYDDIITYWKQGGEARAGVWKQLLQGELGQHMVEVHEYLIRNAYLDAPYKMYAGDACDFATLDVGDTIESSIFGDMWLGFGYRDIPIAADPVLPMANQNTLLCITTPGVVHDIQALATSDEWKSAHLYAGATRLLNYEVGSYKNVRFLQTPRMTLYNCGTIIAQATVETAISAGDGSPDPASDKVDDVYATGQSGKTYYIPLTTFGTGSISDFAVGDIVTIHALRTSAHGVTNGVNYKDGKLHNRRIVDIDTGNGYLVLDLPIMVDFADNLGGGVYAYVTKGRHVHASLFIGGPNGVVGATGKPPALVAPPPVDDFLSMHRFSWHGYFGFNVYKPEVFEVVYSAGNVRFKGDKVVQ